MWHRVDTVIPVPAVTIRILGEIGSKEEAALSGLAPCALAGVGQALITGAALVAKPWAVGWCANGIGQSSTAAAEEVSLLAAIDLPLTVRILGAGFTIPVIFTKVTVSWCQDELCGSSSATPRGFTDRYSMVAGTGEKAPPTALVGQAGQT